MANMTILLITLLIGVLAAAKIRDRRCKEPEDVFDIKSNLTEKIKSIYMNDIPFMAIPSFREAVHRHTSHSQLQDSRGRFDINQYRSQTQASYVYGYRRCRANRRYKNLSDLDISLTSTCPWRVDLTHNADRIPRSIAMARCTCEYCLSHTIGSERKKLGKCAPVFTSVPVIMRTCVDEDYVYRIAMESVAVGCTCSRARVSIARVHNTDPN